MVDTPEKKRDDGNNTYFYDIMPWVLMSRSQRIASVEHHAVRSLLLKHDDARRGGSTEGHAFREDPNCCCTCRVWCEESWVARLRAVVARAFFFVCEGCSAWGKGLHPEASCVGHAATPGMALCSKTRRAGPCITQLCVSCSTHSGLLFASRRST